MIWALVGNNDGPLYILRSLTREQFPVLVGLQKPVAESLRKEYQEILGDIKLVEGFEEKELLEIFSPIAPELVLNVYCNFRFKELLNRYRVLNVHPSPLPRYRGRHPLHWALINGETSFAISIHEMVQGYDAGSILWQKEIPVKEHMSVAELRTQLMDELEKGFSAFFTALQQGSIVPRDNSDEEATYVLKRFPEDSCIRNWQDSANVIRMVMALRSEPNPAYLLLNGRKIQVRDAVYGTRKYKGVVFPQVTRVNDQGFELVCLDGRTIFFSGLDEEEGRIQLNERITSI